MKHLHPMPLDFLNRTAARSNISQATASLLRLLKVKVTSATLEDTLQSHSNYPSLLSIVDGLRNWGVETLSIKTTADKLSSLPLPFIAHLKIRGGWFAIIKEVKEKEIIYLDDTGKEKEFSREEFLKSWEGVVLLAEVGDKNGEPDYQKKQQQEQFQQLRIPLVLLTAIILITFTGAAAYRMEGLKSFFPLLFSLVMLAGVVVSILLLWYEIDKQNPLLQKICTVGKNINHAVRWADCAAILQSRAAKLWGGISWSEIGLAYFTGGFLSLLFSGFNPVVTSILAWLNLLAVPYIFFSVYYQWHVAMQWCIFCLTAQALLLIGFIIALTGNFYSDFLPSVSTPIIAILIVSYLLPLFLWSWMKPIIISAKESRHNKLELLRLKHNPQIFEALLPKQKRISLYPNGLGITLGNPMGRFKLIKVCNPYCTPCAQVHPELEKILEYNPEVSVQIIFTATDDEKDRGSFPVKHLMALYEKGKPALTKQALDDWYNVPKKDKVFTKPSSSTDGTSRDMYSIFAEKYPMNGELEQQSEKLKVMSEWCENTEIYATPTFFVNGYQLPEIYSITDLKYFLSV